MLNGPVEMELLMFMAYGGFMEWNTVLWSHPYLFPQNEQIGVEWEVEREKLRERGKVQEGREKAEWSHPSHMAFNMLLQADSKQLCVRIIFILFNPGLHLHTFPSLQDGRIEPAIAPFLPPFLPASHPALSLVKHPEWATGVLARHYRKGHREWV